MVRECRPPAREPARSWLARRSTMATSTRANASSAANISPVGPPPAITTACFVMAMTVRHDPGLAASPRVWHRLEVERDGVALFFSFRACPPANDGAPKYGDNSAAARFGSCGAREPVGAVARMVIRGAVAEVRVHRREGS